MNIDQHSPAIGGAIAPGQFHHRRLWTLPLSRIVFKAGTRKRSTLVSKDLILDLIERAVVLILFLYFANQMLPRLALLISVEIAYPELLLLAASRNIDAALLVISESLVVFLILTRRF